MNFNKDAIKQEETRNNFYNCMNRMGSESRGLNVDAAMASSWRSVLLTMCSSDSCSMRDENLKCNRTLRNLKTRDLSGLMPTFSVGSTTFALRLVKTPVVLTARADEKAELAAREVI